MQSITQQDDFGCGVACVAFAANINYITARNILGVAKAKRTGYYCIELKLALGYLGYSYTFSRYKRSLEAKLNTIGTIVLLHKSVTYPYGHYLIKTPHGWMDPWINLPDDNNVGAACSGFRSELPGRPYYLLHLN